MSPSQQFVAAVQALGSPSSTAEQRKAAEGWLLEFQRSEEGWPIALELVASSQAQEVQTFAAQALKRRAWSSRCSNPEVVQRLQSDLLHLLTKAQQLNVQTLRQVVLALVATIMPLLQTFGKVLQQLAQAVPAHTTLLVLETLAEEGANLEPFGPGSSEDRLQAVANIKTGLRSAAQGPLSWMAHMASQQMQNKQSDSAAQTIHRQLLGCFQAWVRLGTLHDMSPQNSHSLVSLALAHLQDLDSAAFPAASELLSELMEHCPQEWLPALHEPIMRAAQRAKQAAEEDRPQAAELLCKVVSAYSVLAINIFEPSSSSYSSSAREVLMGLALLPHVAKAHGEVGDPIAWPALATWTQLAEFLMDVRVGGYDVFDDEDFYGGGGGGGGQDTPVQSDPQGNGHHDPNAGGQQQQGQGQGTGGFSTAADLAKSQDVNAFAASDETKAIFEQLLCGLLNNLVMWQRQVHGTEASYVEHFTPTFTATLNDCLACCCSVMGPQRYTGLLRMLMNRPASDPAAPLAAAAAMQAVSAAGSLRLTKDPGSLQTLAGCLSVAASCNQASTSSATFLVPFCCAAAATSRPCLKALAQEGGDAVNFMHNAFHKALAALGLTDDTLDVRTPAAFTIKQLVAGASEASLPIPRQLAQALAGMLHKLQTHDAAAEQALVVALCTALGSLEGGAEAQRNALYETYRELTVPLHTSLSRVQQALASGQSWSDMKESVDGEVLGALRRYALLLQHVAPVQEVEEGHGKGAGTAAAAGQNGDAAGRPHPEGFSWLAGTFIQQLWPLLCTILHSNESVSGEFVQPMCRCMTIILKSQIPDLQDQQLQQWLEVLASVMFRPKGRHAAEPFCASMAAFGKHDKYQELFQRAVSAVLGASRATECSSLKGADKDPDLAEALLKVASSYMRYVFHVSATGSAEHADMAVQAVATLSAACSCANARTVAIAALQCVGSVLSAARESSGSSNSTHALRAVGRQGALLTTGLIGSLLALSPLGRVTKVQSLLIDLGAVGQALNTQPDPLTSWLNTAADQFHLSGPEKESILSLWPGAVYEAAAAQKLGDREQQVANRRIKKFLRDFAELHSRIQ